MTNVVAGGSHYIVELNSFEKCLKGNSQQIIFSGISLPGIEVLIAK